MPCSHIYASQENLIMTIPLKQQNRNKEILIEILRKKSCRLTLIELKQQSKLANLYFFQALDALEKERSIQLKISRGEKIIQLL